MSGYKASRRSLSASRVLILFTVCVAFIVSSAACGGGSGSSGGGGSAESLPTFHQASAPIPVTGPDVPDGQPIDTAVSALLKKWNVPGAAVAIAKNGKLVFARGYGYANFETSEQVQPDSRFRVGSISKVLTSMAVLHLKEQGLVNLDSPFLSILTQFQVQRGGDTRLNSITIRQLLHHSGGWDRDKNGDPLDKQFEIAKALGISTPVLCSDVIRYEMGKQLDFAPGTKFVYSNFGYCILGQVVEKVSGQPLELYIRDHVLATMDVNAMSIGYSHLSEREPREVKSYDFNGAQQVNSVFPGEGNVPACYGGFEMMTFAASGGWIGSAIDLTRVMTAIDGSRTGPFLSTETMTEWEANPYLPAWSNDGTWYGMGIFVFPSPRRWYHGGSLPGGQSMLFHDEKGYTWAIVTNSRTGDPDHFAQEEFDTVSGKLASGLEGSPTDLYPSYISPQVPARTH